MLVVLILFGNGTHTAMPVHNENTLSGCSEAGVKVLQAKTKGFKALAYKCEREV